MIISSWVLTTFIPCVCTITPHKSTALNETWKVMTNLYSDIFRKGHKIHQKQIFTLSFTCNGGLWLTKLYTPSTLNIEMQMLCTAIKIQGKYIFGWKAWRLSDPQTFVCFNLGITLNSLPPERRLLFETNVTKVISKMYY